MIDGEPTCIVCKLKASQIWEYKELMEENPYPLGWKQLLLEEEGTYNSETNQFCCTSCYVRIGMPLGVASEAWFK